MNKMKRNQKGFGAVEGLLILILLSILGFTGYYVYHTRNNANSTYNKTASSTNSPQTASKLTLDDAVSRTQTAYDAWDKSITQGQVLQDKSNWANNPNNGLSAQDLQIINNNKSWFTSAFVAKVNKYRETNTTPPSYGLLGCQGGIAYYHNGSLKVTGDKVNGDTAQVTVTYDTGREGAYSNAIKVGLSAVNGAWAINSVDLIC
jgi:hypothetical protein